MCPPLRDHDDAADLLDLRVVWRADSIQETSNLTTDEDKYITTNLLQIMVTRLCTLLV